MFQLKPEEYINKCTRMPKELVDNIYKVIDNANKNIVGDKKITFSKFVIDACYYALDNLEDNKKV